MPKLHNPRHERVAVGVAVECLNQTDAHENGGFVRHRQNAHRLITRDYMQERIGELQEQFWLQATETAEQHLARLTAMSEAALKANNYGAAIRAEELIGKVLGLYVERFKQEDSLTDEQLLEKLADLLPADVLDRIRDKLAA